MGVREEELVIFAKSKSTRRSPFTATEQEGNTLDRILKLLEELAMDITQIKGELKESVKEIKN